MVDTHCHILPYIDDGAADWDEALKLCENAYYEGITDIIVTPHLSNLDKAQYLIEKRDLLTDELKGYLIDKDIPVNIYKGFEVQLCDIILNYEHLNDLSLNGSRYILCEFSRNINPYLLFDCIDYFKDNNKIMVLAHPERYENLYKDFRLLSEIVKRGALLSLDANSLLGLWGKPIMKFAVKMTSKNFTSLIATDCHSMQRGNFISPLIRKLSSFISDKYIKRLLEDVPSALLNDTSID